MLKTRIITALFLLPLAYAGVFLLPDKLFPFALGLLLLIGSWEFHRLAGLRSMPGGAAIETLQMGIMAVLLATWSQWTASPVPAAFIGCLAWALMFLQLGTFNPEKPVDNTFRILGFCNAIAVITTGWAALSWLRLEPAGEWWILLLLLIVWAADIGAYFSGKSIGGPKLAPRISPGKTQAGFYGGMVSAAVVAMFAGMLMPGIEASLLQLAIIGVVTALVSVGGDLFISMHKRTVGLKDAGKLFPGHGGVMDRLDSLLAGAPFFVLAKLLMGL